MTMTMTSLHQSTNGAKPTNRARAGQVVPLLGPTIDPLRELRVLIRPRRRRRSAG